MEKKYIVVYSSVTGNTETIAKAIAEELPATTPCVRVQEMPDTIAEYDAVFFGFWADRLQADAAARRGLANIYNDKVALFMTCGVPPMMQHAKDTMAAAVQALPCGQQPLDTFICQGKVAPQVIALMYKKFPNGHPHGRSEERDRRHRQAATHPDENDKEQAKRFARRVRHMLEQE